MALHNRWCCEGKRKEALQNVALRTCELFVMNLLWRNDDSRFCAELMRRDRLWKWVGFYLKDFCKEPFLGEKERCLETDSRT